MKFNNSLSNEANETRTDNCEGLFLSRCPVGKQRWPCYISCDLKATKETKQGYRKQTYDLWNAMGMSEIEEQHLAGQNRSIFKNKRLTQIQIQLL